MKALGLTTTAWRSFYEQQEAALAEAGVEYTTLEVPGDHRAFDESVQRRSISDYLEFYPMVLRETLAADGYDVVHANYGLTAPFALAQPSRPVVVSLWGGELIGNRYAPLIRRSIPYADAVIVPSGPMIERLPPSVRDDAHVVPFPVDTELFRPIPRAKARELLGWETNEQVVLFPYAKARYEKNYPLAERVVDGLDRDVELRTVANEPYERVPLYMNASDALLITSRWESGPMTVKEAVACNLPVVSRPVGFVPEVLDGLRHSHVGATERELRAGLVAALSATESTGGRERVLEYGTAEMGQRLREIFTTCLDDR